MSEELKQQAEAILQELGIPMPLAYELFYRQIIVYRGLPFELRVPDKTTIEAMEEARAGIGKRYSSVEEMFTELEV
jgi:DNA-damage-inducible protein J